MYPTPLRKPQKRRRSRRTPILISVLTILLVGSYAAVTITRPFTALQPMVANTDLSVSTPAGTYPWPTYGQGAFGLADGTIVASYGEQVPTPIASVSKVILSLSLLEKYPIALGASGPTITLTDADVAIYRNYIAINGSVMPIAAGQKLTLKQMIQGLMLPSANNIADTAAIWGFGSISAYHEYANEYLQRKGFTQTSVGGDASGYSSESVSTTRELIKLGSLALQNATLKEIVGQSSADIPGTGQIISRNKLLGSNEVTGIKTGNNDGNRGVFLGSATINVNGKDVTVISALSGAPNINQVLRDSGVLLSVAKNKFTTTTIVNKNDVLATYRQTDGSLVQAVASQDLTTTTLGGTSITANVDASAINYSAQAGDTVGTVSLPATELTAAQRAPIVLKQAPTQPDILYRLLHP